MRFFSVAIDGPSGAGKSSLAKIVANKFGFIYADTGAIYRTVGLAAYRRSIDRKDEAQVKAILHELDISLGYDDMGSQRMYLDGEDVSDAIRQPEISICASDVSAHPSVRAFLMDMQRKIARESSVLMDGRDIGTVVLPDADVKIFLTASVEARAERRLLQLREKGIESDLESVKKDIEYRDLQDSTRAAAPLRQAEDAILLDTSNYTIGESTEKMCEIISNRTGLQPKA